MSRVVRFATTITPSGLAWLWLAQLIQGIAGVVQLWRVYRRLVVFVV